MTKNLSVQFDMVQLIGILTTMTRKVRASIFKMFSTNEVYLSHFSHSEDKIEQKNKGTTLYA